MITKKHMKIIGAILMAAIIVATPLISSGCGGGENKVKVGFSICYTGPAAEKGRPMGDAKLDCMKYIEVY